MRYPDEQCDAHAWMKHAITTMHWLSYQVNSNNWIGRTSIHWRSASRKLFRQHGPVLGIKRDDHSSITMKAMRSLCTPKRSSTAEKQKNRSHCTMQSRRRKDSRMVWFIGSSLSGGRDNVPITSYSRLPGCTAFTMILFESEIRVPRNRLSGWR